jgi:hypothetical protein
MSRRKYLNGIFRDIFEEWDMAGGGNYLIGTLPGMASCCGGRLLHETVAKWCMGRSATRKSRAGRRALSRGGNANGPERKKGTGPKSRAFQLVSH